MELSLLGPSGVFSSADAARLGLDRHALSRLCRAGSLLRLSRGWFVVVSGKLPTGEELHRLTATALGRQFRARALLSHHSLLLCRGLPTYRADLATVHLTSGVDGAVELPDGGRRRRSVTARRPGLVIHRPVAGIRLQARDPRDLRPAAIPVAHAIVQAGLLGGPESALVPADAALRQGLTTPDRLSRAAAVFGKHTGIGPVRSALAHADGRHESPGESRTAFLLRLLGFSLEPQFVVAVEGRSYRADFRIVGTRVLVEFDGAAKYSDAGSGVLFEEKRREDALRRAGWVLVRLVWADLAHPDRVRDRILAALALAA